MDNDKVYNAHIQLDGKDRDSLKKASEESGRSMRSEIMIRLKHSLESFECVPTATKGRKNEKANSNR